VTEKIQITFIEGPDTPDEFRRMVGTKTFPFNPDQRWNYLPAPGTEGQLMGVPGVMRDNLEWEIKPVDMRDNVTKLLDEAAGELDKAERWRGDSWLAGPAKQRAELLLLRAQLAILRRQK
jgi:hypothetical protein